MTGLNSGSTPKSPISWSKDGKVGGWWDKYPPNPARGKPIGEREGRRKMAIKGGEVQQGKRFKKLERESLGKN